MIELWIRGDLAGRGTVDGEGVLQISETFNGWWLKPSWSWAEARALVAENDGVQLRTMVGS